MLPKRARRMCVWFWQRKWFSLNEQSPNFMLLKPTWTLFSSAWRTSCVSFCVVAQLGSLQFHADIGSVLHIEWNVFMFMFIALLRVAGSLQKSTEVMKAMQNLVKVPEIQATMRELSKEMMKVSSKLSQEHSDCSYCLKTCECINQPCNQPKILIN